MDLTHADHGDLHALVNVLLELLVLEFDLGRFHPTLLIPLTRATIFLSSLATHTATDAPSLLLCFHGFVDVHDLADFKLTSSHNENMITVVTFVAHILAVLEFTSLQAKHDLVKLRST